MRILIMYKMVTYGKDVVYGLTSNYKEAIESVLDLQKPYNSQVDIFFVNRHELTRVTHDNEFWKDSLNTHRWIIKLARENGYDYVFIVDPDVILPSDTLIKLIETKGDVVGGLCPERPSKVKHWGTRGKHPPNDWSICMPWNKNEGAESAVKEGRTFHVTGCGGGHSVLLNRKAIEKDLFDSVFSNVSSDFILWENARRNGLTCLCNSTVKCKHIEPDGTIIEGVKYA